MGEIKTTPIELEQGELYSAKEGDVVITKDHTFSDVIRWLIEQGCDKSEAISLYEYEESE